MSKAHHSAAGTCIVSGFQGLEPPSALLTALAQGQLGGAILFKRNVEQPGQVAEMLTKIQSAAPQQAPFLAAVDQEGGRVARFRDPFLRLPPARRLGELDDVQLTERAAAVLGAQLRAVGINLDFAPVLDVGTNPANPVIGDRSFGTEPQTVARHAAAFAQGLHRSGVLSSGKHFPGHGDTELDSHVALPRLRHDLSRLRQIELMPFAKLAARLDSIMTAHVVFEALEPDRPATFSSKALQGVLRAELGFEGVIVSDDLEMGAVAAMGDISQAAVEAIGAGCDLVLICSQLDQALAAHEALVRAAEGDPTFSARLLDAARRVHRMRASISAAPALELQQALSQGEAFQRELDARCGELA